MTTAQRREAVAFLKEQGLSARRSCGLVRLSRSSLHYRPQPRDDAALLAELRTLAAQHVRYGYRRVHAVLRQCRTINHKRVQRLWQQAQLQRPTRRRRVRAKRPQAVPLAATYPNHVWTYDFMADATADSRPLRLLTLVDEFTRECLAIAVARHFPAVALLPILARVLAHWGKPAFLRSDNGSEFIAAVVCGWLAAQSIATHHIDPASPWQNAYGESFNGHFRDECLNLETFASVLEAQVICDRWRIHYNAERPHSRLGYQTPSQFRRQWDAEHDPSAGACDTGRTSLSRWTPSVGQMNDGAGRLALPH